MSTVYGCHNREPLMDSTVVQDGWTTHGFTAQHGRTRLPALKSIPDPMSKDCKYTHSEEGGADPKCAGCKHRAGGLPASS